MSLCSAEDGGGVWMWCGDAAAAGGDDMSAWGAIATVIIRESIDI